jgi:hypothetical protein
MTPGWLFPERFLLTIMKIHLPFLLLLAMLGLQITFMFYGPVTSRLQDGATVYRQHTLVLLLINASFLMAGCWLCLRHFNTYGWRSTFLSATEKWGPAQKQSGAGLGLFAFGLIFLGLNVWQAIQAEYVAVSPIWFRQGSGSEVDHPDVAIEFKQVRKIDFNYRETTGQRRGWCVLFVNRTGGEQLVRRNSLVNAAVDRIGREARGQGVEVLND